MFTVIILISIISVYSAVLLKFLEKFEVRKRNLLIFLLPLFLFTAGYYLRLTGTREFIDIGFFFTDSSYLFVYMLFAIFLMLGQLKYWKKR
jgi:predicted tellurium resistance membrane protein TerC